MLMLESEIICLPAGDLSMHTFQQSWGEVCGFDPLQLDHVWRHASRMYGDLPYHNFTHALETLWECMRLADEAVANGEVVNRQALVLGALFHDANYHKQLPQKYESKEVYSAHILTSKTLPWALTIDTPTMFTAQNAILATARGSKTYSLEDKILRRADLANIAGSYAEDFLNKTKLYHQETEMLSGAKINIWDFATTSIQVLSDYLDEDVRLGEWDNYKDRQTVFQFRAIENLKQLAAEIAQKRNLQIADVINKLGTLPAKLLSRDWLHDKPEPNA